jgi:hypothetical protein
MTRTVAFAFAASLCLVPSAFAQTTAVVIDDDAPPAWSGSTYRPPMGGYGAVVQPGPGFYNGPSLIGPELYGPKQVPPYFMPQSGIDWASRLTFGGSGF